MSISKAVKGASISSMLVTLLCLAFVTFVIWLNFFRYAPNPKENIKRNVSNLSPQALLNECGFVEIGQQIQEADNIVRSRNRRIIFDDGETKNIQYWIAVSIDEAFVPTGAICSLHTTMGGVIFKIEKLEKDPES